MSNWKKVKLEDICINITDGVHNTVKDTINEQYYLLSCKNIKNGNVCIDKHDRTIGKETLDRLRKRTQLSKGDVLLSSVGTIGETAIVKEEYPPYEFQRSVAIFKPDKRYITSKFLFYSLNNKKKVLQSMAEGAVQQCLFINPLKQFQISIPPLDEQKKIAGVLSALDDKIELNNKINRNLEAQAQAIFKSWFIDFEPFKNGKFIDSELGKIPEGWKVEELGKVSKNIREKVVSRTNIPVLSAVKEGRLILSEEYFSKQVYSKSLSKYILVKENDYAYNPARVNIGSLGRNTICSLGCVSPVYIVFEIDSNYLAFFDLYFKMKSFKNEVKLRASGSVRQTLSYDDFSLIKVIYPPKSVSSKFNKLSAVFSEKITRNKKESRRLAQLRDTLLPKLMSGKIDISDVAV